MNNLNKFISYLKTEFVDLILTLLLDIPGILKNYLNIYNLKKYGKGWENIYESTLIRKILFLNALMY